MLEINDCYLRHMEEMIKQDKIRLENSKGNSLAEKNSWINFNYPTLIKKPLIEARMAYATPLNYFQYLYLDGFRVGNHFSHGSTRAIFFHKERLYLISKHVKTGDGPERFTSFFAIAFEKKEYKIEKGINEIRIRVDCEKKLKNPLTGSIEVKKIEFSFVHKDILGKLLSKTEVAQSPYFKKIYGKQAFAKAQSVDMIGFAVSVPHLSPHPYIIQCSDKEPEKLEEELNEKIKRLVD